MVKRTDGLKILILALLIPSGFFIANSEARPVIQEERPFNQSLKLAELTKQIAGQENRPAEEVFKNIQLLKGMPAARLLKVMELGYSRSLGVTCTHCHVVDQWEKDEKPAKQIARDMIQMTKTINTTHLKNIKNLRSPNPVVNCTTCHRGKIIPELNLPEK